MFNENEIRFRMKSKLGKDTIGWFKLERIKFRIRESKVRMERIAIHRGIRNCAKKVYNVSRSSDVLYNEWNHCILVRPLVENMFFLYSFSSQQTIK
jgi:hypothetical protein